MIYKKTIQTLKRMIKRGQILQHAESQVQVKKNTQVEKDEKYYKNTK